MPLPSRPAVILGLLAAFLTSGSSARAQEPATTLKLPPRLLPLAPADLLARLPAAPDGWKVSSSTAMTQPGAWIRTLATRKMEWTPPPDPARPAATPAVWRTTLTLIDTGYDPTSDGEFEDFHPGETGGVARALERNGPTIRTHPTPARELVSVFVKQRFIYRVELENQPAGADKQWENRLDAVALNGVPDQGEHRLPARIELLFVDELHPARNRKSIVYPPTGDPNPRANPSATP